MTALLELGIPSQSIGLEFSGKKGYHVWVVLPRYRPATELMRVGSAVRVLVDQPKMEVFPKQAQATDLGNLIKLPGCIHRVTGNKAEFLQDVPTPVKLDVWEHVLSDVPEIRTVQFDGEFESGFACMDAIQKGMDEGGRNNALFHFAGMLRRSGLHEEHIAEAVFRVNQAFTPPLPDAEVATLLVSSQGYGPMCGSLPQDIHCGDACIKERYKLGLRPRTNMLRDAAVGDSVVVEVVDKRGNIVVIGHPDLLAAKGSMR
jgi:hypothetical protein